MTYATEWARLISTLEFMRHESAGKSEVLFMLLRESMVHLRDGHCRDAERCLQAATNTAKALADELGQ
jgi:hypothetical protein